MAGDWRGQYLAALRARDAVEKANVDLYNYCARVADQKAELQKMVTSAKVAESEGTPLLIQPPPSLVNFRRVSSPPPQPDTASVIQMRQDLAKAQQERSDLQTRFDQASREFDMLKSKSKQDSRRLAQATATVNQLNLKLRDREEELRGKAKLVENVQDENVTLNLQLHVAEEQRESLKKENQDLVDRWMARMGKEADLMNEESKFQ